MSRTKELIEKYLVNESGMKMSKLPSLDSLKMKGNDITSIISTKWRDIEEYAKRMDGMERDIIGNIAWAMKKGDKKRVLKLIRNYKKHIDPEIEKEIDFWLKWY